MTQYVNPDDVVMGSEYVDPNDVVLDGRKEKPYSAKRQAQAAVSGFNRVPALLAGLPADTLLNLADLAKAGLGVAQSKITGQAPWSGFDPANRSQIPLSSAWLNRGLDAAGVTAPSAEQEYPGTAAFATGAGSALAGRPQGAANAVLAATLGGTSSQVAQKVYERTGDPAAAALASVAVPATAAGAVVGTARLSGKFLSPAEETARLLLSSKPERRIAARTWERMIGEDNLPIVRQSVVNRAGQRQSIPGYQPTVAELLTDDASGSYRIMPQAAGVQAVQKSLAGTAGAPQSTMRSFRYAQDDALRRGLAPIAGDEALLAAARGQRAGTAAQTYSAAFKQQVKADQKLVDLTDSPYFQRAYDMSYNMRNDAARKQGAPLSLTQELHYVKLQLDDMINRKVGDLSLPSTERQQVYGVQRELVNWLKTNNKAYDVARETFKQQSVPINRMEVGQVLQDKLMQPRGDRSFIRTIADEERAVKSATDQPRSDFGQVFSPRERDTVYGIGGLLERRYAAENPMNPVRIGAHDVANEAVTGLPNLLYRPAMIANWIIRNVARGNVETKVDQLMAMQATNPKAFADALQQLPPNMTDQIVNAIASKQRVQAMGQGLLGGSIVGTQQNMNEYSR